jgi:putative membrane protein
VRVPTGGFDLQGFAIRFVINAAALAAAAWLLPSIRVDNIQALLLAALIFGLANAFIKPILAFITCPLIILTLGLFTLVLNAIMMGFTSWVARQLEIGFEVDGFWAAFVGAIIVSVVSWVLTQLTD